MKRRCQLEDIPRFHQYSNDCGMGRTCDHRKIGPCSVSVCLSQTQPHFFISCLSPIFVTARLQDTAIKVMFKEAKKSYHVSASKQAILKTTSRVTLTPQQKKWRHKRSYDRTPEIITAATQNRKSLPMAVPETYFIHCQPKNDNTDIFDANGIDCLGPSSRPDRQCSQEPISTPPLRLRSHSDSSTCLLNFETTSTSWQCANPTNRLVSLIESFGLWEALSTGTIFDVIAARLSLVCLVSFT